MTNSQEKQMRAVILAAGLGKRMQSETAKVLHPVLGRPMIWRILETLNQLNKSIQSTPERSGTGLGTLEEVHVVLGHNAEQVEHSIEQYRQEFKPGLKISLHIQKPQLGTGHALMSLTALDNFKGDVIVLPGDCPLLTEEILDLLLDAHFGQKANVSLLTTELDDPTGYGRILRSASKKIIGIVEDKDASDDEKHINEINASVYCLNWPSVKKGINELKNNNKQGEYYLTDIVGWAVGEDYKIASALVSDWRRVMGINSRNDLARANKLLNEMVINKLNMERGVTVIDPSSTWISPEVKIEADTLVLPGCWIIGDISIGRACTVGPHTSIEGKVKIGSQTRVVQSHLEDCQVGDKCQIGPFAHLRMGTVLDNEVRVGNFVELKMSTVGKQTNVSHLSYVGDTTVGSGANIGAGTITANYDHITKIKSPTIIEDGVAIGSNAVLVAPVKLGKESVVAAGTVITKDVEPGALAVGRSKQENMPGWTVKRRAKNIANKKD